MREVNVVKALRALITSALRFRMSQADKAMWVDMVFYKNNGISERMKHGRYRAVVQASIWQES